MSFNKNSKVHPAIPSDEKAEKETDKIEKSENGVAETSTESHCK